MSGSASRNKGRRGEQEAVRIIRDQLGFDVRRNWQAQSAEGGADLTGIPGWAVEIKRWSEIRPADLVLFQAQALRQARLAGVKPAVWYRADRGAWTVSVPAHIALSADVAGWVDMPASVWMNWVREQISADAIAQSETAEMIAMGECG